MANFGYVEGRDGGLGVPDNVILRCCCADRCELEVEKHKGDTEIPDEYYIILKSKSRYNTLNMFEALKIKLKKIWYIIRGKDYIYYDIDVESEAMKKFADSLQKLINN